NFQIPDGTALGAATVKIGATLAGTASIQTIAPTIFTASASGSGLAATTLVTIDGVKYLSLYGTGIRGRSSPANVSVTINGTAVPTLYAGPQGAFLGLDQINVPLPATLPTGVEMNVVVTVDSMAANVVTVSVPAS